MQTSYKILFCDGTRDNLIVDGLNVSLESNPPNIRVNQGCATTRSALAIAIGYLHWNYKKIKMVSGGDHNLMREAHKHSEFCRELKSYQMIPSFDWSRRTYEYDYVMAIPIGPIIPDEVKLEALIPQFDF